MPFVGSLAKGNFENAKNNLQDIWIFTNSLGKCEGEISKYCGTEVDNGILIIHTKMEGMLEESHEGLCIF